MRDFLRPICLALILGLTASAVFAAPINYGNFPGDTVTFLQVTEDSSTDPTPLFGAPTASNDSLSFSPVSFGASANGGAVDVTDGTLVLQIQAFPGQFITDFNLSEAGDYTLIGAGTASSSATVSAATYLIVHEVNGVGIVPQQTNANLVFTPSNGDFYLPGESGVGVIWTGSLNIDIDAFLASKGISGHATLVTFSMDNILVATSEAGTFSTIKKKTLNGVTISIPEPAIGMLALVVLPLLRRRHV